MSSVAMSLRTLHLRPVRPLPSLRPLAVQTQALSLSAVRQHKESESDPDFTVEQLKEQSLKQHKEGRGEWMPGLASDSEEALKADKSDSPELPAKTPTGPNNPTVRA
ncbi:hypothetical protein CMQ_4656 [Grosmannia clavigera kw1407]|uniref:Mitochondrial carrier protein n=1 Tax=Grosmannia clavigera (strain kw1407 / UAMH 11150) TaxID=655863 RepID=F0XV19_GROCL|nr:uncharacterized protein CMQ_4656 [Grosmannia clavigera kw1407]EFW98804.1 hypothetical protein CMQ_4656 [Grosmannia clavigera kw1407]